MADGTMVLGVLTFLWKPTTMNVILPKRSNAVLETYTTVAFFTWGTFITGKTLQLQWDMMETGQFDDIVDLVEDDVEMEFDPGEGVTYQVQITDFDGAYFKDLSAAGKSFRKDVRLSLVIISQNT
jgi:hypothetical protein